MSIKTGLFLLTFVVSLLRFLALSIITVLWKIKKKKKKKLGKNKNKLRTLKIKKILRTASLGSNFTGSYKKKSVFTEIA